MKNHISLLTNSDGSRPVRRNFRGAVAWLFLALGASIASAATFNWPTSPAWPATGPTNGNTSTVDYSYNAQGSLVVSVFNSGVTYEPSYPKVETGNNRTVTGGTSNANNTLMLFHTTTSSTSSYTQVTVAFNYTGGANGVSFTLWDVDEGGQFIDQISQISANRVGGGTVYATVTGSTNNQVTGSGTSTATATGINSSGSTSSDANVSISFGTAAITSLTFRWANTLNGTRGDQYIGISPISFTPIGTAVPEVGSAVGALALCGGLMLGRRYRRRRPHAIAPPG